MPGKGSRKLQVNRQSQLIVLLGFIIGVWMKAPVEMFVAFVIGIGGNAFSFMWGNSKEHQAGAASPPATPATQ